MAQNIGDLRVWWCPQIGVKRFFYVPVSTAVEGKRTIELLANYDLYQYENRVKGDYANTGGLEEWDGKEWIEWQNDDGYDISELSLEDLEDRVAV